MSGVRRVGASAVVAGLVVLAGCNLPATGPGGAGTPSATATPTDAPTPTDRRQRPSNIGVTAQGVTDPVALARAHGVELAGRSFATRDVTTVRAENGTVLFERTERARVAADHATYAAVRTRTTAPDAPAWVVEPYPEEPPRTDTYSNGTAAAQRLRLANGTTVTRVRVAAGAGSPHLSTNHYLEQSTIVLLFGELDTTVADVRAEDGTTEYVLTTSGGAYRHGYTFPFGGNATGEITSFRAVVTEYGLVRELALAYRISRSGTTVRVRRELSFSGIGRTTVDRPTWADETFADPDAVLPNGSS